MLRYFVNGLFIFHIFNGSSKININKTVIQSVMYTILLALFKTFVIDHPIITSVSCLIIFGCLLAPHKLRMRRLSLTYSLFVTCILEYNHFGVFRTVSYIWEKSGIPDVTYVQNINLILFRLAVFIPYMLIILAIYKSNKVRLNSIRKLSQFNIFPIFLSIALCMIMYLKYYIKYTESNKFHDILSVVFVFFIVLCLIFLFSSEAFLKMIETYQKNKNNQAIEEAKLQKGKNYSGLKFTSENLIRKAEIFENELALIGIDIEDKKAKQLVHCAVLLSQEDNPLKVNMVSRIYSYTGEILSLQPKSIETNISNLLKNHWSSCDSNTLKLIENNYHGKISDEIAAPTPKEFLVYIVLRHHRKHNSNNLSRKIMCLFFKKYSLDA